MRIGKYPFEASVVKTLKAAHHSKVTIPDLRTVRENRDNTAAIN